MKRKILKNIIFLVTVSVVISGCGNNTPSEPVDESVPVNVTVNMMRNEWDDGSGSESFTAYAVDAEGNTLTEAEISLIGPDGIIGDTAAGIYSYTNFSTGQFLFNSAYAVSVTHNAVNYYGTFNTYGDITVASDGSSASWPYTSFFTAIHVSSFDADVSEMYFASSSPFNISATGVYAAGPGEYSISVTTNSLKSITFNRNDVRGFAVFNHDKSFTVEK